jgi:RimJ/RimL family protein N-acetyltransferase
MIERLETQRLTLRAIRADDVDLLVALDADPEVMRFINGGQATARADVADTVRRTLGHRWLAYERAGDEFVGWFALDPSDDGVRELGYRLRRTAWGKGYATEGATVLLAAAFTRLGAERVWAQTMTANVASRAVMQRCGLRYVRTFFGDWGEPIEGSELGDVEYELTISDWQRRPE